ncbi:MarR family winged helix-turn-helix transcriptional regulator [Longispora urticae]
MTTREQALDQVIELVLLFNEDMDREFARLGLSASRVHLLWELRQRGAVTQRELADALKVSARNITGLVDGLVETGFVTRQPHPTDRRATLVAFTARGAETMAAMARDHEDLAGSLFDGMPDFAAFVDGVGHVTTRLRAAMAEAAAREAGA